LKLLRLKMMHTQNGHKILLPPILYLLGWHALTGAAKDTPIITPLMDFVRQKRAAKGPRVFFCSWSTFEISKLIWLVLVIMLAFLGTCICQLMHVWSWEQVPRKYTYPVLSIGTFLVSCLSNVHHVCAEVVIKWKSE